MYTLVPLSVQNLELASLDFLNGCLILAKERRCFFHLWFQIKSHLKPIPSKGQNHELLRIPYQVITAVTFGELIANLFSSTFQLKNMNHNNFAGIHF